jgi:hypothetical protein
LNIITVLYYFMNSTARPEIARATHRIDYSVPHCAQQKKKSDPRSIGYVLNFYTTPADLSDR